jgi:hypothetical protein
MGYPVIEGTAVDDTVFRRTVQAAALPTSRRINIQPPREWMN